MKSIKHVLGILCVLAMMTTTQAQTFLTNGLVAYYPFNGNANDASGNGNSGTNVGGYFNNRYGSSVHSLTLTNINVVNPNYTNCIRVDIPASCVPTTSGTISAWINPSRISSGAIWGRNHPTVDGAGFTFGAYPQQYVGWPTAGTPGMLYFHSSNSHAVSSSTGLITQGIWQQVVVTFSASQCTFYINGTPAGTVSGNNSLPTDTSPSTCCLGAFWSDALNYPPQPWTYGDMRDVRIYNRALATNEVAQLYSIESAPIINIQKAVYLTSSNLHAGTNYQVQVSSDLLNWTNSGSVFTATTNVWRTTNYWDVANWNQLFFRLQEQ
jgi:hypothetical protein